jgi:hypothetical protein
MCKVSEFSLHQIYLFYNSCSIHIREEPKAAENCNTLSTTKLHPLNFNSRSMDSASDLQSYTKYNRRSKHRGDIKNHTGQS